MDIWSKYDSCKTMNENLTEYYEAVKYCHSQSLAQIMSGRVEIALDVACGNGDSTQVLSQYSEMVLGIDSSESLIEKAKQTLSSKHYRFECQTFEDANFGENRFDLISSTWFLNNVHTDEGLNQALEKMHQLLRPEGKIIFIVPSASYTSPEIQKIAREQYGWLKAWTEVQETHTRGVFYYGDQWIPITVWQPMYLMKTMTPFFNVQAWDVKSTLIQGQRLESLLTEPPFEIIYGSRK